MSNETTNSRDVRMRGFAGRALVEDALAWVDEHSTPLPGEKTAFDAAHGRVLAADVASSIDVPSFDRSAMDGYAVRGAETEGAGDYNPLAFRIVGEALPGRPFAGEMPAATAVRIMTGAPLPASADAVVPAEYATEADDRVEITSAVSPGKHVGRRGEDVAAGGRLLAAGRRLRPQDLGLLASVGVTQVEVVCRPRVRLLITGDELVPPGEALGEYQIYESNSSMLAALVERDGAVLESLVRVKDDREAIGQALRREGADVILISGGSSVGREDHAPGILAADGELAIHGIAMRPSSPAGMGTIGSTDQSRRTGTPARPIQDGQECPSYNLDGQECPSYSRGATSLVFLLPGNPVSCLCAYDFFAGRAIRRLGGLSGAWPYPQREAEVGRKIVSSVGRVDYCRVRLNAGRVEPLALSGASILSSTTRADGFVVIPAESEGYAPGTIVPVYLYDPPGVGI